MEPGFGAFGKMPALGDFFRLRVSAEFIALWDPWLQGAMLGARGGLGERFDDCYMTSPVWRFSIGPGVGGAAGLIGVMMPSVDRVGRMFPLTLVTESAVVSPFRTHFRQSAVFDALEALALDALGDEMTRDILAERLATIDLLPDPPAGRMDRAGAVVLMSGAAPEMLAADLALAADSSLGCASVWSCTVDGKSRIFMGETLPRADQVIGLFDLEAPIWVEHVYA